MAKRLLWGFVRICEASNVWISQMLRHVTHCLLCWSSREVVKKFVRAELVGLASLAEAWNYFQTSLLTSIFPEISIRVNSEQDLNWPNLLLAVSIVNLPRHHKCRILTWVTNFLNGFSCMSVAARKIFLDTARSDEDAGVIRDSRPEIFFGKRDAFLTTVCYCSKVKVQQI